MNKPTLDEMSLREKIGQTAVARQNLVIADEEGRRRLVDDQYGCMWMMGKQNLQVVNLDADSNYKAEAHSGDYLAWIEELNSRLKIPFLAAMDCERGIRSAFSNLTEMVSPPVIGAAGSEELAREYGACIARELKCAGAKWWWGPVVDLSSRYCAVSIGRTASSDVDVLTRMALAEVRGAQENGVAATVKHFPSGGLHEYRDAHITNTVNDMPLDEWFETQGKIYQAAIDAGVYAIMAGHCGFPAVDDTVINENYIPTTLSHKIITGLLKEKMGFKGVVVTDAIGMGAVTSVYERDRLYVELLRAGNDAILGPTSLDYVDVVEKAVLSGDLPESRIDDACQRILDMKEKLGMFREGYQAGTPACEAITSKTRCLNRKAAEKSITLVCDKNGQLPLEQSRVKNVAIICSSHSDVVYERLDIMKAAFEQRGAAVHLQRRLGSKQEIETLARDNDLILYATYLAPHQPMGASSFYGNEFVTFAHALSFGKDKSIGVSLGSPYIYYDFLANIPAFINIYNFCDETQEAFVAALYGEIPFEGQSPFEVVPPGPRL